MTAKIVSKGLRLMLVTFMKMASKIYPTINQYIEGKRAFLYSMWIRNFLGGVGEKTSFIYPLRIQGGGGKRIRIGANTLMKAYCILGCHEKYRDEQFDPDIIIGNNCSFGEYNHITAINKIMIGDGLLTGRFVYIGDNTHGGLSMEESVVPPIDRKLRSKGEIIIGNNVWIGDKVTILGGVTIGDNVIIGANSVVTHNLPSNCVAAGIPAKVIKIIEE